VKETEASKNGEVEEERTRTFTPTFRQAAGGAEAVAAPVTGVFAIVRNPC